MTKKSKKQTQKYSAKPFLKWAGGKRAMMPVLLERIPAFAGAYHEPFLGGGALFFELYNTGLLDGKEIFLSDANDELINAYRAVRDSIDDLIAGLELMRALPHDAETYYKIRAQDPTALSSMERATRFFYLNHACRSGLPRFNSQGGFNTPFGKYTNPPRIFDENVLRASSRALQGVTISCEDFRDSLARVQPGDFVYIDPPYDKVRFTEYTPGGFKRADQERLALEFERLEQLGALAMMSNSASDWVRERYAVFRTNEVMAPRFVNSDGKGRGPVKELLIQSWHRAAGATPPATLALAPLDAENLKPPVNTRSPELDLSRRASCA